MKAVIVQKFSFSDVEKDLKTTEDKIRKTIIRNLCWVGEQCVVKARNLKTYQDITGNLRSSIAYVVLENGQVVNHAMKKQFEQKHGKKGDGSEGLKTGKELLEKMKGEYPLGFVLVVVAGMEYAAYVEEVHNRPVIAPTKLYAEEIIQKLLHDLKFI